jgi:hypothetical protein
MFPLFRSWSYGSWIYNYMCNQCLSPLKLWFRTPFMARCIYVLDTTICDKVYQQDKSWQYFPVFHTLQENKINYYSDKFLQLDLVHLSHNLPDLCQLDVISDGSSNRELIIQAHTRPSYDSFRNTMNFSIGELVFNSNFKNENPNLRSSMGLND